MPLSSVACLFRCGSVLGFASCFLIIRYSAINSTAAAMAEVSPIMYQAFQAGKSFLCTEATR